jgi:hypothetical protein
MSKSHQKKRNSGLLYEFLVREVSRCLVEGDVKRSNSVLKVLRKHFRSGSELYKEFRLINSLVRTTVTRESVAGNIVSEAKAACRGHDVQKLDRAKTALLKDIARVVKDDMFFDQHIDEYRVYATVQTLLNEWRKSDKSSVDLSTVGKYEDTLVSWLLTEKVEPCHTISNEESPGTNRLIVKVMTKKLNEKYRDSLTQDQVKLVKAYALSTSKDDPGVITSVMKTIKENLVKKIDGYVVGNSDKEKYVSDRLIEARRLLEEETLEEVDDGTVVRFLSYIKLDSELSSDGE